MSLSDLQVYLTWDCPLDGSEFLRNIARLIVEYLGSDNVLFCIKPNDPGRLEGVASGVSLSGSIFCLENNGFYDNELTLYCMQSEKFPLYGQISNKINNHNNSNHGSGCATPHCINRNIDSFSSIKMSEISTFTKSHFNEYIAPNSLSNIKLALIGNGKVRPHCDTISSNLNDNKKRKEMVFVPYVASIDSYTGITPNAFALDRGISANSDGSAAALTNHFNAMMEEYFASNEGILTNNNNNNNNNNNEFEDSCEFDSNLGLIFTTPSNEVIFMTNDESKRINLCKKGKNRKNIDLWRHGKNVYVMFTPKEPKQVKKYFMAKNKRELTRRLQRKNELPPKAHSVHGYLVSSQIDNDNDNNNNNDMPQKCEHQRRDSINLDDYCSNSTLNFDNGNEKENVEKRDKNDLETNGKMKQKKGKKKAATMTSKRLFKSKKHKSTKTMNRVNFKDNNNNNDNNNDSSSNDEIDEKEYKMNELSHKCRLYKLKMIENNPSPKSSTNAKPKKLKDVVVTKLLEFEGHYIDSNLSYYDSEHKILFFVYNNIFDNKVEFKYICKTKKRKNKHDNQGQSSKSDGLIDTRSNISPKLARKRTNAFKKHDKLDDDNNNKHERQSSSASLPPKSVEHGGFLGSIKSKSFFSRKSQTVGVVGATMTTITTMTTTMTSQNSKDQSSEMQPSQCRRDIDESSNTSNNNVNRVESIYFQSSDVETLLTDCKCHYMMFQKQSNCFVLLLKCDNLSDKMKNIFYNINCNEYENEGQNVEYSNVNDHYNGRFLLKIFFNFELKEVDSITVGLVNMPEEECRIVCYDDTRSVLMLDTLDTREVNAVSPSLTDSQLWNKSWRYTEKVHNYRVIRLCDLMTRSKVLYPCVQLD